MGIPIPNLYFSSESHSHLAHPLGRMYLMWLLVLKMKTPDSSQAPLLTRMFSCTVQRQVSFLEHTATAKGREREGVVHHENTGADPRLLKGGRELR